MDINSELKFERYGKIMAIAGVILFSISFTGYRNYREHLELTHLRISSTYSELDSIQSEIDRKSERFENVMEFCETVRGFPVSPFGSNSLPSECYDSSIQKAKGELTQLISNLQSQTDHLQKRLPNLHQEYNQLASKERIFYYLSIITFVGFIIGLLLIFGRSLAFLNRGGNVSIGNIHDSKTPINSGQGSTVISSENISDLSVESYSNSVKKIIRHLPTPSNYPTEELKAILNQIQELITASPELSNEKKMMALEQVKIITEASEKPADVNQRKLTDQAIMILKGIAASLPDAAKLAETLSKLLPALSAMIGV